MPSKILFSSILLYFLDEYRGISRDSLHSSGKAQFLCGRCLDGNIFLIRIHHLGKTGLHRRHMRIELRTLSTDGCIDIAQHIPLGGYQIDGFLQQNLGIHIQRLCCRIWE